MRILRNIHSLRTCVLLAVVLLSCGWGCGGTADFGQCATPDGNDYVQVSAGQYHSLALKLDGTIVGWGNNSWGQTIPPYGNDYVRVAAGGFHSLALKQGALP